MKVVLLASASSVHTIRWANALIDGGIDLVLASQHPVLASLSERVRVVLLPYSGALGYFTNAPALKRILAAERPDLLNAHYASGYGTMARLAGFHPCLLSVWGSDVYQFPHRSTAHRWWLRGNLKAATGIASTSRAMAEETRRICSGLDISITPFGVDSSKFVPDPTPQSRPVVTIGTVKTLKPAYGIDVLVDSFAAMLTRFGEDRAAPAVRLRIVGSGPQRDSLEKQVANLGISLSVDFVDAVSHAKVPEELRRLDIYATLSRRESFGVAAIEAGACGLPVVVSDAGGLPEVVIDGQTGLVVPKNDPAAAAAALTRLVLDEHLRRRMGEAARRHVMAVYEWRDNVRQMIELYERMSGKHEFVVTAWGRRLADGR